MRKICIFHFSPLELYPPVMNMINFLGEALPENCTIKVYTSFPLKKLRLFSARSKRVQIKRYGKYDVKLSAASRYILYLHYYSASFLNALLWRPYSILYYETFSAPPPLWIKKLRPATRLFIHYHEYVSPGEYDNIPMLKRIHRVEKKIYHKATWISHTNADRLKMFARDVSIGFMENLYVMPNYPSRYWSSYPKSKKAASPFKIIYIGAIGLKELYIREFAHWVEQQHGKVVWHIYSQQDTTELKDFLTGISSRYIAINGFVAYEELPGVLQNFDAGVILYKGSSKNFIYNAPNKLFEYLASGLDVWFPNELKGAYEYIRTDCYPKVIKLDFKDLDSIDIGQLIDRDNLQNIPSTFTYEEEYKTIANLLSK